MGLTRVINVKWCLEDVQAVRPDLNEKQAAHVLETLKKTHDANIGINWETVSIVAQNLYEEPENFEMD